MCAHLKKIEVIYFAILREERGTAQETIETQAATLEQLYSELKQKYHFKLPMGALKAAVNDVFVDWQTKLKSHDTVVFIPPFGGG